MQAKLISFSVLLLSTQACALATVNLPSGLGDASILESDSQIRGLDYSLGKYKVTAADRKGVEKTMFSIGPYSKQTEEFGWISKVEDPDGETWVVGCHQQVKGQRVSGLNFKPSDRLECTLYGTNKQRATLSLKRDGYDYRGKLSSKDTELQIESLGIKGAMKTRVPAGYAFSQNQQSCGAVQTINARKVWNKCQNISEAELVAASAALLAFRPAER